MNSYPFKESDLPQHALPVSPLSQIGFYFLTLCQAIPLTAKDVFLEWCRKPEICKIGICSIFNLPIGLKRLEIFILYMRTETENLLQQCILTSTFFQSPSKNMRLPLSQTRGSAPACLINIAFSPQANLSTCAPCWFLTHRPFPLLCMVNAFPALGMLLKSYSLIFR